MYTIQQQINELQMKTIIDILEKENNTIDFKTLLTPLLRVSNTDNISINITLKRWFHF